MGRLALLVKTQAASGACQQAGTADIIKVVIFPLFELFRTLVARKLCLDMTVFAHEFAAMFTFGILIVLVNWFLANATGAIVAGVMANTIVAGQHVKDGK